MQKDMEVVLNLTDLVLTYAVTIHRSCRRNMMHKEHIKQLIRVLILLACDQNLMANNTASSK
jgi:hypothetical protein